MDQKALWKLTYGLYLLTARQDGRDNGCIINTAVQVAENPARISISVIKKNLTCEMILNSGKFNLSCLDNTVSQNSLLQKVHIRSSFKLPCSFRIL